MQVDEVDGDSNDDTENLDKYYKTFYSRNLLLFMTSLSVCHLQVFPS